MQKKSEFTAQQIGMLFPVLTTEELLEGKHPYKAFFISVFNHWLSEDECNKVLIRKNRKFFENKLMNLYKNLYSQYAIYVCLSDEHNTPAALFSSKNPDTAVLIDDITIFSKLIKSSIDEFKGASVRILVPEIKIIINSGYDYTLPFFLTKDAEFNLVKEIVEKNDLHVLQ